MNAREVVAALRAGGSVSIVKPTVPEVVPVVRAYYNLDGSTRSNGGSVHVIVEDGNIDRELAFSCLASTLRPDAFHGEDCDVFVAWLLTQCSRTQRGKLYGESFHAYHHGDRGPTTRRTEEFWSAAETFMASADVEVADDRSGGPVDMRAGMGVPVEHLA